MLINLFIEEQRSSVVEADDLSRLRVEVYGAITEDGLHGALGSLGRVDGTEHAWIFIDELRRASGRSDDANWQAAFDGMVEFAEGRGWTDANQKSLRAHIASAQLDTRRVTPST